MMVMRCGANPVLQYNGGTVVFSAERHKSRKRLSISGFPFQWHLSDQKVILLIIFVSARFQKCFHIPNLGTVVNDPKHGRPNLGTVVDGPADLTS